MHTKTDAIHSDVKAAFDAACIDVFHSRVQRPLIELPGRTLLPRFAQHYQHLLALPRRARRSLQRQWKRSLGGVALLLALTPGAAFAATMNVAAGVAPDVTADGKCSLNEAIFNANNNTAMHPDCPPGSGTDTIILPVGSKQILTNSVGPLLPYFSAQGVPKIRSAIVIEGRGSTIERADGSPIDVMIVVETNGNLTLNETIVNGRPAAAGVAHNDVLPILNRGGLSIAKGSVLRGYAYFGGGLRNEGMATLRNSTVAQNTAGYDGGGIYNSINATLILNDSVVSDNYCGAAHSGGSNRGGGIYNRGILTVNNANILRNITGQWGRGGGVSNEGVATVRNSNIVENSAAIIAGGIENDGTLTVEDTVISGNSSWLGGGISNGDTATIIRSTIADNLADSLTPYSDPISGYGGGIFSDGTTTLADSTISGNRTYGYGGGISVATGTLTLTHSTVTSNRADYPFDWQRFGLTAIGGGISAESTADVRIERSLISGNQSEGTGPEIGVFPGLTPTIVANNFNVFGASGKSGVEGFAPGPTDIVPTVPVSNILVPLANNGGKGATHALAITSPALNAAPIDAACTATDQRGNPRPQGVKCDIGAFEGSAVLCNGLITTQVGTVNADTLTGTNGVDVIAGLNGNDTIRGLNGNDVICAGSGADKVYGGNNNDLLFGDSENDQLFGDAGNDALGGGAGTDRCNGGSNTDTATQCESVTGVP